MTRVRWVRSAVGAVACLAMGIGGVVSVTPAASAAGPEEAPNTEIVVWGNDKAGPVLTVPASYQKKSIVSVAAPALGASVALALDSEGKTLWWGNVVEENTTPTTNPLQWVGFGSSGSPIGIDTDGTPWFWGTDGVWSDQLPPALGPVTSVSANRMGAAAVRADGTVTAWASTSQPSTLPDQLPAELTDPATAHATQVAITGWQDGTSAPVDSDEHYSGPVYNFGFAVRADGSLTPFGLASRYNGSPDDHSDPLEASTVPADLGPVKSLTLTEGMNMVDQYYALAVMRDGTLRQWGDGGDQWSLPLGPDDKLDQIAVSRNAILGLTEDHRLIVGKRQWRPDVPDVESAADTQELYDNTPWEKLNGRKIVSIATTDNANIVVTADPDPATVVTEATVTGAPLTGSTILEGTPATFSDPTATVSNQWLADGEPIPGATDVKLTPTFGQVGQRLSFRSSITQRIGDADHVVSSTSEETDPVVDWRVTKMPSITGVAKIGETLTGVPGEFTQETDAGAPFPLGSWEIDGASVSFDPTYTVKPADEGKTITYRTRTTLGFVGIDVSSDPVGPVVADDAPDPMSVDQRGSVSGTAKVGRMLTGTPATFNGGPSSVSNQWLVDGEPIDGATETTYTPVGDDVYKAISFRSTATRGSETLVSTSDPTAPIAPGILLTVTSAAKVSGTPRVGSTLTGTPAVTNAPGTADVENQWLANGAPIGGAAGTTLQLGTAQIGASISFRTTVTYDGVTVESTSPAIGPVTAPSTGPVAPTPTLMAIKVTKKPKVRKAGRATITVTKLGAGPAPSGKVTLKIKKGKKTFKAKGTVVNGVATVKIRKLPKGTWKIKAVYAGDASNLASSKTVKVKVKK